MDAVEYLKEKARMTNKCNECKDCPLSNRKNIKQIACMKLENTYPEIAVEIVENWSKEHPVKTYLSVLLEKFPKASVNCDGIPGICVNSIFGRGTIKCINDLCKDCWNREYKEE